jgi:pimeloyl-ACP methyl ester carboxylesterase
MADAGVRSAEIRVNGVRAPLLEAGDGSARAATVFVHGSPGSSRDWTALLSEAGAFGRALALDMPGFGRADKPADFEYTVPGYARWLEAALVQLGVAEVQLVLHDFGGPWGLAWAAARPAAVRSVVLINTGVQPGYRWHYMARIWRARGLGELSMLTATRAGFRLGLSMSNPQGLPREFVDRMYDDFDRGTRRAVLRLYRASDPSVFAAEVGDRIRSLACPALVVWGAKDPYISPRFAERQRDYFPGARVVMLERSGHWPFMDDPKAVAAAVLPFLREHAA